MADVIAQRQANQLKEQQLNSLQERLLETQQDHKKSIKDRKRIELELKQEIERIKAAKAKERANAVYAQSQPLMATNSAYTGDLAKWLLDLRTCESGGDYRKNTGNGYYGAYQFSITTWNSWNTGYERADLAPPAVQDEFIIKNTNRSPDGIASQNPGCYQKMGLSQFPPKN